MHEWCCGRGRWLMYEIIIIIVVVEQFPWAPSGWGAVLLRTVPGKAAGDGGEHKSFFLPTYFKHKPISYFDKVKIGKHQHFSSSYLLFVTLKRPVLLFLFDISHRLQHTSNVLHFLLWGSDFMPHIFLLKILKKVTLLRFNLEITFANRCDLRIETTRLQVWHFQAASGPNFNSEGETGLMLCIWVCL